MNIAEIDVKQQILIILYNIVVHQYIIKISHSWQVC